MKEKSQGNWNVGPPPSIGWWPASYEGDLNTVRWWDGNCWSIATPTFLTAEKAAEFARIKCNSLLNDLIRWRDKWWE